MHIAYALTVLLLTQQSPALVSASGGYEIKMPGAAQEQSRIIPSPAGDISNHFYLFQTDKIAYYAAYSDYPAALAAKNPEQVLETAAYGAVREAKGKLLREKKIAMGSIPGRETDYTMPIEAGGVANGRSRIFLDKTRLYQVTVLGQPDAVNSAEATAYLDSLKIRAVKTGGPVNLVSAEGRFEVKLPKKPFEAMKKVGPDGKPIDLHVFLVDLGKSAYFVSYEDYTTAPTDVATHLNTTTESGVAAIKGKIVTKKSITHGVIPGLEADFTLTFPDGSIVPGKFRSYLDKARLYQQWVISKSEIAKSAPATAFLQSFNILPEK